ncbi:DsbA family oxidoreductase [Amycolatopsis azurea]|uniref:2-hydroxychromene-2-carboxylate isomerase n=1 Tax=Amycolatopsis azurea DSM 43854 TaxID=1238180 RepID=M2QDB9_9PSEU|nr:DsbA family oxidoreductase [Amycolatopsis azurea]EMD24751.1 2-hydroxychromene-2-carboxylate isomerase [Amycolatopsis azurea DSM 43854]OOC08242.1 disulfide bond formation protein DsbA [Amycolatopsis azurea DSM 43854]
MRVEVWSDVGCPWCYLGKRRLEKAIGRFEHGGVEVVWRSFQLAPQYPQGAARPLYEALMDQMGGTLAQVRSMVTRVDEPARAEGLTYDFDSAYMCNTFDAHRVAQFAGRHGLGAAAHERLLRALLVDGEILDDTETLVRLAVEIGLDAGETRRVLAGDDYADAVREDAREARRLGADGVPFFVIDRTIGVSGAESADVLLDVLREAQAARSG